MEAFPRTKELYELVLNKKWEKMKKEISKEKDIKQFLQPISIHQDNIIHLAVHSKEEEPLQQILEIVDSNMRPSFTSSVNAYGNTVLHEAAICRNYKAVKLLVKSNKELLDMKNDSGETPLYRAAAYGNTKIVKFLISQQGQRVLSNERKVQLKGIHRNKKDGTALELLKVDEELAELEDKNGSSLYVLANIPSVFKSKNQMGIWEKLFYHCLPVGYGHDDSIQKIKEDKDPDIESGLIQNIPAGSDQDKKDENGKSGRIYKVSYEIYISIWDVIIGGWLVAKKIWKEKRASELAIKLARILIRKDKSINQKCIQSMYEDRLPDEKEEKKESGNPLFAAIRTGNVELVKFILDEYPQAHEQTNSKKQNILHAAAKHRQKDIFKLVKSKEVPMVRLARQTDVNGNTFLHSAADTEHYKGGARSGPAYQLLEELKWFKRVEKIVPSYYTMLPNNNDMTAYEVFEESHKIQHKEAQQWIKDASQSCSAVAALVSTVVFAAAFTVPGGNNDKNGRPILINSPFFLFFTISDIISLSCSLTAIVMFLGIMTSPFELENFLDTIPRKLTLGFALLFMSVATTMLAFASTIFLVIRLDERRRWTTTLICCAAFFPVSVLALTHFPLFASFIKSWEYFFKHFNNWTALPRNLVARFFKFLGNLVGINPPPSKDKVDT